MSCALDLLQGHITLSIAQKVHAALLMASIIAHLYVLGVRLRPIGPGRIETDVRTIQLPAVHPICQRTPGTFNSTDKGARSAQVVTCLHEQSPRGMLVESRTQHRRALSPKLLNLLAFIVAVRHAVACRLQIDS